MKKIYPCLIAACIFTMAKAQTWSELGGPNSLGANNWIEAICTDRAGNIYAGGNFKNNAGEYYVAKYNGNSWSQLGGPTSTAINDIIYDLCSDIHGNIYAAGVFTNTSEHVYVAEFNGQTWAEVGGLNALANLGDFKTKEIICLYSDNAGNLYAGGQFTNPQGNEFVAKWNGSQWTELGGANSLRANGYIYSICGDSLGNIYAAGGFTGDSGTSYVAKYNGVGWSQLGNIGAYKGDNSNTVITSICSDPLGNIYAAGLFVDISNHYYVAKWNGLAWSELGGMPGLAANNNIYSVNRDANGNIYTGGAFSNQQEKVYMAEWNGASWTNTGGPAGYNDINFILAMCRDPYNNIYVAGTFTDSLGGYYVAKYGNAVTTSENNYAAPVEEVQLFPNPTTGNLRLISTTELNTPVSIFDMNGQLVFRKGLTGTKTPELDVHSLPAGSYLLELKTKDGNSKSFRFIKE